MAKTTGLGSWGSVALLAACLLAGCYDTRRGVADDGWMGAAGSSAAQAGTCASASCRPSGQAGGASRPGQTDPSRPIGGTPMTWPMTMPPTPPPMTAPPPVPMLCSPQVQLQPTCTRCSCTSGPDCAFALSNCDANCWALMSCVFNVCGSAQNIQCVSDRCSAYLSAAMVAQLAAPCVRACLEPCSYDLGLQVPQPDVDAGT